MVKKTTVARDRRKSANTTQIKGRKKKIAETIAAINQIKAPTPQAAMAIALLKSWLADESGYDEETWPKLKKALDRERDRVGARRLFNG